MTRRKAGYVGAMTALSYSKVVGANDKLRMGYIGLGNRGDQVHEAFLEYADQETVAVCDLKESYMDFAAQKSRATPKKYADYRRLLEDKNVDAIAIGTPDHWHAIQFIDACHAGKDVYVEKPLSLTVAEGRRMVEVANETKRVTQVGIQRRSTKALQEAAQFVREGGLGKVTLAQGFHLSNEWPTGIGQSPDRLPVYPDNGAMLMPFRNSHFVRDIRECLKIIRSHRTILLIPVHIVIDQPILSHLRHRRPFRIRRRERS